MAITGGIKFANIFANLLPAPSFGAVYVYSQGLAGLVYAGEIGLIYGTFFLHLKAISDRWYGCSFTK